MAPACKSTRRVCPLASASTHASSLSKKTAISLKKCTATTGPPTSMLRVRSAIEGFATRASVTARFHSNQAFLEAFADRLFRQVAADEHEAALTWLAVLPRALVVAIEHHVHTLEH